jgi:hypothetical protein
VAEIALFAVLHDDLHLLLVFIEVVLVDPDQVGVGELLHEFDLEECLFDLEGVYLDLLEGEGLLGLVPHQVDAAEAALPDYVHRLVGLHQLWIMCSLRVYL